MARHGSISIDSIKSDQSIRRKAREMWLLRICGRLSYNQIAKQLGASYTTVWDYVQVYKEYVASEFVDDLRILDEIASCEFQIARLEARRQKLDAENDETRLAYTREIRAWTGMLHELQGIGEARKQEQHLHLNIGEPSKTLKSLTEADRKEIYDIALRRRIDSPPEEYEAGEQGGA